MPLNNKNNHSIILHPIKIVIILISSILIFLLIYGGVEWILKCNIDHARGIITQALVALTFTFGIWALTVILNLFPALGKFLRNNVAAFEYLFFGQVILALSSTQEIYSHLPLLLLCIFLTVTLFLFALFSLDVNNKNPNTIRIVTLLFMIFILLVTTITVGMMIYTKAPEMFTFTCK